MRSRHVFGRLLVALLIVTGAAVFGISSGSSPGSRGEARLIAYDVLPETAGESCEWEVALPQQTSYAAPGVAAAQAPAAGARMAVAARPPLRFIQDPYPAFSSIAVSGSTS